MRVAPAAVALATLALAACAPHAAAARVVELTDATFEHQTQAATGQTTGAW